MWSKMKEDTKKVEGKTKVPPEAAHLSPRRRFHEKERLQKPKEEQSSKDKRNWGAIERVTRSVGKKSEKYYKRAESLNYAEGHQRDNQRENRQGDKKNALRSLDLTKTTYIYFGTSNKTTNGLPPSNSTRQQPAGQPTASGEDS